MKKYLLPILTATLCLTATSAFAQTKQFIKGLNLAKIERVLPKGSGLAPRIPGVYIPAGTNWVALERKVATVAQTAGFNLNARDARVIAYNPALLRQFEQEVGHPVFEGRPLPIEEGRSLLRKNQANFAKARANNEYEAKWEEFIKENDENPLRAGKLYKNDDIGQDVYNFYVKYIGVKDLPRVRDVENTYLEGVVCEIPVRGLTLVTLDHRVFNVLPELFAVVRFDDGSAQVVYRRSLEFADEIVGYRVIK